LASHIIASEAGARQAGAGGSSADAVTALAARNASGAFVAVTAGEGGVYWDKGHVPAFPVRPVDTLAAGDIFHGAFAFGLTQGWETERNLRFASAAAAIKCTRAGGRLGAPSFAEVETFLAERA
jgi:sulfofructose kinase